ncbi:hypothetical protein ACFSM5_21050 [Lacibacterium aquatile]|uniref:Uncharacterized protein n=1 Tax=Lacibacterium aquatile TaxID=1168082 RepID=A0ABW5DY74_9PROT
MPGLFDIDGPQLDRAYVNIRAADHPGTREIREVIEQMWPVYESYADPGFAQGFAQDVDARFWEMYLGCTLLEAGRTLLPANQRQRAGGQPDLCVLEGERRIWIEAIAPGGGDPGPDQVVQPMNGVFTAPTRQTQLRLSSAFFTKAQKLARYLQQGVIAPDEPRIIAISGSRLGGVVFEVPLPPILNVLFPVGDAYITVNRLSGEVVNQGFHHSPVIERGQGEIPRTAFLVDNFSHVSGVIWSSVGLGNMSRKVRPISYVHNPRAQVALPLSWGIWDREYVLIEHEDGSVVQDILAAPPANSPLIGSLTN